MGYICPGTAIDWVYETLHVEYSFSIEIYKGSVNLFEAKEYIKRKD